MTYILSTQKDAAGNLGRFTDPSLGWWLASAAKCGAGIASWLVPGVMALKGTRLIAKISKLTKSSKKIADAVKKLGGVKKSAKELLKKTANDLRSKLPASARGKLKAFSQSTEAKVAAGALAAQLKDEIWDLLSLGSCAAMWKNR